MDGQAKVSLILELKEKLKSGLAKAKSLVNDNVRDIKGRLNDLKVSHIEAFSSMKDQVPGLSSALELLANPYTLIIAAVVGLSAAVMKGMEINRQWEAGMAKVNVTAQLSKEELHNLDREVDAIARRNTVPYAEVPAALNRIISAGLNAKEALKALEPTLKAAKAGFTDIETVAGAGVSVMNSSGVKDITKVYDILFATLNKGNAEFKDIANYLPKIIPAAKNVGVSLEDTAGAYAYLTAQGQTAEKAATMLENTFKTLGDPDKVKKFDKIGVSIFDATGKMRPMVDIAKELNTALTGLTDQQKTKVLSSLGLDMESSGAFASLSQDVNKLKDSIDFTTNSAGQLDQALANGALKGDSWLQISNQIDSVLNDIGSGANTILGQIGDALLPVIVDEVNRFKDGTSVLNTLWEAIQPLMTYTEIIVSKVATVIGGIVKEVADWVGSSQLLKDTFWAIGQLLEFQGKVISGIFDVVKFAWDHTIGPQLERIERVYRMTKELLGFDTSTKGEKEQTAKGQAQLETWLNDGGLSNMFGDVKNVLGLGGKTDTTKTLYSPTDKVQKVLDKADKKDKSASDSSNSRIQGSKPRTVNININEVIAGDFITKSEQFANMGPNDFEKWFTEMLRRYQANNEMGYN